MMFKYYLQRLKEELKRILLYIKQIRRKHTSETPHENYRLNPINSVGVTYSFHLRVIVNALLHMR